MKKVIATLLCLSFTTPCFAFDRRHAGPHPAPIAPPHPVHMQMHTPVQHPPVHRRHHHRISDGAKVAGVVAGVAGIAILVAALAD